MATKKEKKHVKRRKTRKTRKHPKKKRGGCGCNAPSTTPPPSMFVGGSSFSSPDHSFYAQNMYKDDPQGGQLASRLMKGGSKRSKGKKRGGGSFGTLLPNDPTVHNNPISSFGTSAGASLSNNIIMGQSSNDNTLGVKNQIGGSYLV